MADDLDYAPVGIYDDEEELLRNGGYAPAVPAAPPVEPGSPASAMAPPVTSSAPMPAVGSIDAYRGPDSTPAAARPQWKDYAPAQPHGWGKVGHALAALTAPTNYAFNVRPEQEAQRNYRNATAEYEAPVAEQEKEAQTEHAQSQAELERQQAETLRKTGGLKQGLTPEETTIHDLMTGEGGQPRVNPQTGKPYSYLEAYGAVNQAKQDTKPDPAVKDKEKDISDFLAAHHLDDTPANREAARQGIANRTKDPTARNDVRADRSYQFHSSRIDKLATPIEQRAERISRLEDTLNQNSPQADTLVAPELLTVMAGGQGSGLRMNEAEIARVIGGRDKWESIKSALQQWQLDPTKPFAFQTEQRKEIRDLFATIRERVNRKMEILDRYRGELTDSDDPKEHRRIVNDLQRELNKVDAGGHGGEGKSGKDFGAAPSGKADGATGTLADGTKVVVKGRRLVAHE